MCYKKFRRSWVKQSKIYHFRGPWIHLGLIGGCPLFSGPLKCLIRRARSHYIDHPGIATLPCHFEFGKSLQSSFLGILQTFTFGLFLDMSWRLVIGQIGFPHLCFFSSTARPWRQFQEHKATCGNGLTKPPETHHATVEKRSATSRLSYPPTGLQHRRCSSWWYDFAWFNGMIEVLHGIFETYSNISNWKWNYAMKLHEIETFLYWCLRAMIFFKSNSWRW